jgi:hypothetical protein
MTESGSEDKKPKISGGVDFPKMPDLPGLFRDRDDNG